MAGLDPLIEIEELLESGALSFFRVADLGGFGKGCSVPAKL